MPVKDAPVARETLYALVWSEPLIRVGERFGVPASLVVQACEVLGVPRPAPGYWSKLAVGKAPERPPLLAAATGAPTTWKPGDLVSPPRSPRPRKIRNHRTDTPKPLKTHPLIIGARALFQGAKTAYDSLYLRPRKRLLVDLVVSEAGLDKALSLANRLFSAFEAEGHQVTIAANEDGFHHHEVDEREVRSTKDRNGRYHLWRPQRITVAHIGTMAIGLTIIELSENVPMRYVGGEYVRETEVTARRARIPGDWSWTTHKDLPTGRFSILAYSPYAVAKWSKEWRQEREGPDLDAAGIVRTLENAVPDLTRLVEEGKREAERQHQIWKAQYDEWKRQEEEKRRAEAREESRKELTSIIEEWAAAKRLDSFFADAHQRLNELPEAQRSDWKARLDQARELVGSIDALGRFQTWNPPNEQGE